MATYTITELAREFDITPRAIRFYEDQGLISPTREGTGGRVRIYGPRDRTRLKLTLRGKRLGLTLSEIKDLVDMSESPQDSAAQTYAGRTVYRAQARRLRIACTSRCLITTESNGESHDGFAWPAL